MDYTALEPLNVCHLLLQSHRGLAAPLVTEMHVAGSSDWRPRWRAASSADADARPPSGLVQDPHSQAVRSPSRHTLALPTATPPLGFGSGTASSAHY